MAVICFAAAAVIAFQAVFPITPDIDAGRELSDAAVTLTAGLVYWLLAANFRVWMVYFIVALGFTWGLLGLAQAGTPLEAALILTTLLWTTVFVGAAFRPQISRIFAAYVTVGILFAMWANTVPGGTLIGVSFAGSFVVIMEILSRATSQLRHEATTDAVTGLLNRTGLERRFGRLRTFGRDDRIAVMVADLDGFKVINDEHGHRAGDEMLRRFATAWRDGARAGDLVARFGGDEFVFVFLAADERAAAATAKRLRRISPVPWSGGFVLMEPGESLESCMNRADRLLYLEKADKAARRSATAREPGTVPAGAHQPSGRQPIPAE